MGRVAAPQGDRAFTPALAKAWLTPVYDLTNALFTRERTWRRAVVRAANLAPGDHLIDVGSGTGSLLRDLMISCPQAGLIGVEPDPAALAIARRKFGAGADLIRWRNGILDTLDLTARWQPNKIVSSLLFHQVPPGEKRAILERMHMLLQPGGMVLVADYMAQESALMRKLFRATVQQLDGVEDTQPNADGIVERLLAEIFTDAERLNIIPTATGAISLWRGYEKGPHA